MKLGKKKRRHRKEYSSDEIFSCKKCGPTYRHFDALFDLPPSFFASCFFDKKILKLLKVSVARGHNLELDGSVGKLFSLLHEALR